MNAKLISVFLIAALASPAAFAGESFGRDSVYAAAGGTTPKTIAGADVKRSGRDSIYAWGKTVSTPIKVGNVTPKFGRA